MASLRGVNVVGGWEATEQMIRRAWHLIRRALLVLRKEGAAGLAGHTRKYFEVQLHLQMKRRERVMVERSIQAEWPSDKPLVSVIIPCYNYGQFITGAIQSVLSQTLQRLEILVIDDGSTEEITRQVLRSLTHQSITVIRQENQGLAQTRNNGAALAAGKYLCFLDPDDLLAPCYLEKTVSILEMEESLGSCYSWVQCFGEENSIWETADLDPFFLSKRDTAPSHSLIRKRAWEKVTELNGSGFLTKYNGYCEDWVFWIDMVQCGFGGRVIREPLIYYRVHKSSLGATHKPGYDAMMGIVRSDRRRFFCDRSYRRSLEQKLNHRVYVLNPHVNLHSSPKITGC